MFISSIHVGARWRLRVASYLAELNKSDRLLDAGCGEGFATRWFASRVDFSVGVDIVAHQTCIQAAQLVPPVAYASTDLLQLPFADNTFTVVICTDVLEHVSNVRLTMVELKRVTHPAGRIIITVPISEEHGHFGHNPVEFTELLRELGLDIHFLDTIRYSHLTVLLRGMQHLVSKYLFNRDATSEVDEWDKTFAFNLKQSNQWKRFKWVFTLVEKILTVVEKLEPVPFQCGDGTILATVIRVPDTV